MARITRKKQKIFAANASNNGVFGSLQANDPTTSTDPDVLQGRSAFEEGWNDATYSAELLPPLEEFQGLQFLFSRQIAYLMQEGVAEWDSGTTYYKGSIVKKISGTRIWIYISIVDNNTNHQVTDTARWKLWYDSDSGYADVNFSNITDVAKNIGNWSLNVTNCITEIPQDINLTLSSGTLTLKSGSKCYISDDNGGFTSITTTEDKTFTSAQTGSFYIVYVPGSGLARSAGLNKTTSGSTAPENPISGQLWYDTTNNVVKRWSGSAWSKVSFPLAIVTGTGGSIASIDQVFNGFGYIGSTVFALPGVKGLIPNGRNEDGTLKNTVATVSSVKTGTINSSTAAIGMTSSGTLTNRTSSFRLNEVENITYQGTSKLPELFVGKCSHDSNLLITSFYPRTPFHAADYNDVAILNGNNTFYGTNNFMGTVTAPTPSSATDNSTNIATTAWVNNASAMIAGWAMPNYSATISVSAAAQNISYTAPSNGFVMITVMGGTVGYVTSLTVNDVPIPYSDGTGSGEYKDTFIVPLKSGDVLVGTSNSNETFYKTIFVPCIGG